MAQLRGVTCSHGRGSGRKHASDRLFQSSQRSEGHACIHKGLDPRNRETVLGQQRELPRITGGFAAGDEIIHLAVNVVAKMAIQGVELQAKAQGNKAPLLGRQCNGWFLH